VRALVISNMLADPSHPERGSFVRDQVAALRAIAGLEVDLFEFAPGTRALARAAVQAPRRRGAASGDRRRAARYDVVHAHFGLTGWPALAVRARVHALTLHGTDVMHPRTRVATLAVLPLMQLVAGVSSALTDELPRWARRRAQVLPCGVDVERFRPISRDSARAALGLERDRAYILFPADPARAEKRFDRARALCEPLGVQLLTLGGVVPASVPVWINAVDAVVVPSEREGFGLSVLEALACEVPVLATPVGIHAEALAGVAGSLCAPFALAPWRAALEATLRAAGHGAVADAAPAQRPGGGAARASAERFSAQRMAQRVADAWHAALRRAG
jgi:teichuronic acid biosynthesis glycosyltransferase TuaC